MVNGEDNMIIMDGQKPDLLRFEPLRLFKRAALGAVAILAGFEMKLPAFAFRTRLQHTAHRRRATIHNRADRLALLI